MSEVLTRKKVEAVSDLDMVRLKFGSHEIVIPYRMAFEVLAGIRMAGKMAMRYDGNPARLWTDLAAIPREGYDQAPARKFRLSRLVSNVEAWDVKFEPGSPLVIITFEPYPTGHPLQIKIHYSDALQFYSQIRVEARKSKAWAGDTSRIWSGLSHISDAEDNYKRCLNNSDF